MKIPLPSQAPETLSNQPGLNASAGCLAEDFLASAAAENPRPSNPDATESSASHNNTEPSQDSEASMNEAQNTDPPVTEVWNVNSFMFHYAKLSVSGY